MTKNSELPVDMILLSCSNPNGICFVETSNLNGETNYKPRRAIEATKNISEPEAIWNLKGTISVEHPNEHLGQFSGILNCKSFPNIPLNSENLLLRVCYFTIMSLIYITGRDSTQY